VKYLLGMGSKNVIMPSKNVIIPPGFWNTKK